MKQQKTGTDFATFKQPGGKPLVNSIFDVSEDFKGQFRLWLEQNPPSTSIANVIGYKRLAGIRGIVASDGTKTLGTGFSSGTTGTGVYTITYDSQFATAPAVFVTLYSTTAGIITVSSTTTTVATIRTFSTAGAAANGAFHFWAVPTETT